MFNSQQATRIATFLAGLYSAHMTRRGNPGPGEAKQYANANKNKMEKLAGRFAAKEAILKLLGTGWRGKIAWTDIEIINNEMGQPQVMVSGEVKEIAQRLGIGDISVSITHTANFAIASATALTTGNGD